MAGRRSCTKAPPTIRSRIDSGRSLKNTKSTFFIRRQQQFGHLPNGATSGRRSTIYRACVYWERLGNRSIRRRGFGIANTSDAIIVLLLTRGGRRRREPSWSPRFLAPCQPSQDRPLGLYRGSSSTSSIGRE